MPELAVFVSMLGENPTVLKLAVDNVNLSLCDLRDLSVSLLKEDSVINSVTLVSFSYHSGLSKMLLKISHVSLFLNYGV